VYGEGSKGIAFPRQALHAWRVVMRQPATGRELTIEAPLPEDMRRLAGELGLAL
jgi:23S rRNA pseudouridine1911/1915/1917 synthase